MFSRKFLARNNVVFTVTIWLTQRQIIIIRNDVAIVVKNVQLVYLKRYTNDVGPFIFSPGIPACLWNRPCCAQCFHC